jgi:preprotein translocase subunit SecA
VADALALYEAKCAAFPEGLETAREIERDILLQVVDTRWREHLSDMDYLKDGIHLRQVAQIDPLTAWQKEGYELFGNMLEAINRDYVRFITHVDVTVTETLENEATDALVGAVTNAPAVEADVASTTLVGGTAVSGANPNDKLGRNDPCWCGSGKKFKQCHGRP